MHLEGEKKSGIPPEKMFPGQSLLAQAARIKALIELTHSEEVLDYGSGKGLQYMPMGINIGGKKSDYKSIPEFWHIKKLVCYDPGYQPFSTLPVREFDGVICTDVLEHCPEEDIDWVVNELFRFAKKFVFGNIARYPADKFLPNGENAHCTIKPIEWWRGIIEETASQYPTICYEFYIADMEIIGGKKKYAESIVKNN